MQHEEAPSSRRSPGVLEVVAGLILVGGLGLVAYSLLIDSDGNDATLAPADSSTAGLDVSCFAYRDVDRDGTFDVDDRPFAWLPVRSSGPNGTATTVSNTAGFANFEMLLDGDTAFIDRSGTYEFAPEVPDGWELTSDAATQSIEFVELPGSPVGPGYVNGATSGEYVAYNSSGNPATISSDDAFDFVGADISSAWPGGEAYDVVVQAWREDDLVHVDRFAVSTTGPVYFDADYRSITRLELSSDAHWQFVVDDAEFRLASAGG